MAERPLGVTIIGILWIIGGLLLLMSGIGAATFGGLLLGPTGTAFGAVFILLGLFNIIIGIGCFTGWSWVWTIGVILTLISLLNAIYAIFTIGWGALLSLLIAVIILYYLFQPNVKAYFGKA
jgi:hypothetical protein